VLVSTIATCLLAVTIRRATTNISILYAVSVSLTVFVYTKVYPSGDWYGHITKRNAGTIITACVQHGTRLKPNYRGNMHPDVQPVELAYSTD
jgi:(2Fe-2S) ferredoxin